jgi:hypothetical protein
MIRIFGSWRGGGDSWATKEEKWPHNRPRLFYDNVTLNDNFQSGLYFNCSKEISNKKFLCAQMKRKAIAGNV